MVLWKPWIVALIPWTILSLRRNTTMVEKLYREEERGGQWDRISENKISSLRIVYKLLSLTLSLALSLSLYIYIYSIITEDQEPSKGFYTNRNLTTYNYYSIKSGVTASLTVIKNNQGSRWSSLRQCQSVRERERERERERGKAVLESLLLKRKHEIVPFY